MRYKNGESALGVDKRHPILGEVLFFTETRSRTLFNIVPTITGSGRLHETSIKLYSQSINPSTGELFKPEEVPYGVHEIKTQDGKPTKLRGTDLRSSDYEQAQRNKLVEDINDMFEYDPTRPHKMVAMCHALKGNEEHFHLQVHPRTRLRA